MKQLFRIGKRRCVKCKQILDLNESNFSRSKSKFARTGYTSTCKACVKDVFTEIKKKYKGKSGQGVRKRLIDESDFSCTNCHIRVENYSFFDIDHIIPRKIKKINRHYYSITEIDNLQVLCPNCHRLKTIQENSHITKIKERI